MSSPRASISPFQHDDDFNTTGTDQRRLDANSSLDRFASAVLSAARAEYNGHDSFEALHTASSAEYSHTRAERGPDSQLHDGPFDPPSTMGFSETSSADDYYNDPDFVTSHTQLRFLLLSGANSQNSSRRHSFPSPETALVDSATGLSPSLVHSVVLSPDRIVYLVNYIQEVASWLDMFDEQQTFGKKIPVLARSSPTLLYAMLAISARQTELQQKLRDYDSISLYQEAIRSLTPHLLARDPDIIPACVILCCLEMMSAKSQNWRGHLDGCAALFQAHSVHGFSGGVSQAVFWCYARMDLCAAIISEGEHSLVLPLEKWLPPNAELHDSSSYWLATTKSLDMYANLAVFLCAKVCHFIWQDRRSAQGEAPTTESSHEQWHELWYEVSNWALNRPPEFLPIKLNEEAAADAIFPFILLSADCAISSNQLYHTACILLLDYKPLSIHHQQLGVAGSKIWHARRVCGISLSNEHHGCWNNSIQPLWVAGKILSHPTEHKAVVDLMGRIEHKTGWGTSWRVNDLTRLWGYDKHEM